MNSIAPWNAVASVSQLKISGASGGAPEIYANGRHQAIIDVELVLVDEENRQLAVDPLDVTINSQLVDSATGDRLGEGSAQGWAYAGAATTEVCCKDSCSGLTRIRMSVTCSASAQKQSMDLAVQVMLINGTEAPNLQRGFPSSVRITTRPTIDYGRTDMWEIASSDFEIVTDDVNFMWRLENSRVWYDCYEGISRWAIIPIFCKVSPEHQLSVTVMPDVPDFAHIDSSPVFEQWTLSLVGKAQAYTGWNAGGAFNIAIWFINPAGEFGIDRGDLALNSTNIFKPTRRLHIGNSDRRHRHANVRSPSPGFNLCLWSFFDSTPDLEQAGWQNQTGIRRIMIEDNFGNRGILKMRFDYNSNLPVLVD